MHLSYKNILKNAWQITWQNKLLWLLGIFASFISLEAVYEIILSQISQAKKIEAFHLEIINLYQKQVAFLTDQVYFLSSLAHDYNAYIVFILLAVIILLFIWLIFVSQIFIINSAAKLYKNKRLNLSNDLSGSHEKFWPVLGVNVITKLLLYAGFIALSLPLLYAILSQNKPAIATTNLFFFIAYVIFAVIVSFIAAYATNFIVLKDSHILEAFSQAWKLFSKNITLSLEIAFVLFLLKILSLIIIFSLTFLFVAPIVFIFMLATASNNFVSIVMTITLSFLIFTLVSLLVNAIFTTFYLASWTITFIQLTEETFWGKLTFLAKKMTKFFKTTSKKYDLDIKKNELKAESKKIAQKLEKEYKRLEPKAKKEAKVAAQKLKTAYNKLEPKLEKEIKKIIEEKKKKIAKPKRKTTDKKTTTKKRPTKKTTKTKAGKSKK